MMFLAYGMMWCGVSAAVALAVYVTGTGAPLWALLIPALISFKAKDD